MDKIKLEKIALASRILSIDAIQEANSGHPGLPLGAAELGAYLYGYAMNYNADKPDWINRDRFILSAGHGSMFLYSHLHFAGFKISIEDIKNFRKLGGICAGHPEYGIAPGVDATTGPLGQGLAMGVGVALGETIAADKYNTDEHTLIDHYTYVLVGDGCLAEGITSEASSLAGHLKLGKLIVFYDSNRITIDGSTDLSFTENVEARYHSYGWQVLKGSMYSYDEIDRLTQEAKNITDKPTLIILESDIGKGSPNKQGTADVHGSALGVEEVALTKENLGVDPSKKFYVEPEIYKIYENRKKELKNKYNKWMDVYESWSKQNPELAIDFSNVKKCNLIKDAIKAAGYKSGDSLATREASAKAISYYSSVYTNLVGGSADLSTPNRTSIPNSTVYSADNRGGRYIHYGVREFAMAAIANGLSLYGCFKPFVGTFLAFSDYLRPALRLSALMKLGVLYVFTHDSIYVGEDGPTHQAVEHLASLRAIPNVLVQRPGDPEETLAVWGYALENDESPTILALTRQGLPVIEKYDPNWIDNIKKGAYIAKEATKSVKKVIIATGSEVALVMDSLKSSNDDGKFDDIRVISMPCRELFYAQAEEYQKKLVPKNASVMVVEAGIKMGWERLADPDNILSVDVFGESGPASEVAKHFNFTNEKVLEMINNL